MKKSRVLLSQLSTRKENKITALEVYLEKRKERQYIGTLTHEKLQNKSIFIFRYESSYQEKINSIPLGPEFPLSKNKFDSEELFPTFLDRIPSKKNAAYEEYCSSQGISPDEKDELVLLCTIGRRGPSSFIFEPLYENEFGSASVIEMRRKLGLTVREFSKLFDVSPSSLQAIELGKSEGKEIKKRLEIYYRFPAVALWEVEQNGKKIHEEKRRQVLEVLKRTK